ncbi:MAG: hypothetical protein QOE10_3036 [Gaiellales bacterium]|jgi:hypothetical protein|nr:hypothetical protein [Gaiellales bacterium]
MSHHFDTKRAKNDPSMNICDMYVFRAHPGSTVMAMTVSADAGLSAPDALPVESMYSFRFDTNRDTAEEVVFKFRFGAAEHADGDEHRHVQSFRVLRAQAGAIGGDAGDVLIEGKTGEAAFSPPGVRAFVGMAPELWAADAIAFFNFLTTLNKEDRFDPNVFLHQKNFFKNRNVMALVLEVPNAMIGVGQVRVWATASLFGHAPEVQICRWGLPLFTHLYLSDPNQPGLAEKYHQSRPSDDVALFRDAVATFITKVASRAGSTRDPQAYGQTVASRLCPVMLPYELDTDAAFGLAEFNGRPLGIDAYDVMLTLAANRPITDGVAPDRNKILGDFPYYGNPYDSTEQAGLDPISTGFYE